LNGPRRSYAIPAELAQSRFVFYERADGTALATTTTTSAEATIGSLVWFDASGKVLGRHSLAPFPFGWSGRPHVRVWVGVLSVPVPIAGAIRVATDLAREYRRTGQAATYAEGLAMACREAIPAGIALALVSAVLAVLTYRRQRKYGLPWAAVWAAFVFLGGIPGFLGFRFHRRWAAREGCPACAQVVPRDRESCAHCGTEFPRPAPRGTEVFA
jgi:hypothetical protein